MKITIVIIVMCSLLGWFAFTADTSTTECVGSCVQAQAQGPAVASIAAQSMEFASGLLNTDAWPARWNCGQWSPLHGWMYIVSDVIIWLSYFMIPVTLSYFIYRKKTEVVPFQGVIILFIAFILACGLTHLIDAVIFWWPAYRLSAAIRLVTAFVSLGTVFALVRIAPQVMEFKSPTALEAIVEERTKELKALNERYEKEIHHRQHAENQLKILYAEMEQKNLGLEEMNRELLKREHDLIKSEERFKQLNADLELQVSRRTRQLEESNKELEAFTYSVSHDLRAPLRAIDGYARILEEDLKDNMDANSRRLIHVITKNARYMGQLIDDLLEFSRVSRVEAVPVRFNTSEEVQLIVEELTSKQDHSKVTVNIGSLQDVKGDHTMLKQVWVNILSNAFKYSSKNPAPVIDIGCRRDGDLVVFHVSDNGVGFDMQYVDKLFGVFQRLHRNEEFEGTGVGLALVKRILDRHRGSIRAEATPGKGATFYFALPA